MLLQDDNQSDFMYLYAQKRNKENMKATIFKDM